MDKAKALKSLLKVQKAMYELANLVSDEIYDNPDIETSAQVWNELDNELTMSRCSIQIIAEQNGLIHEYLGE